MGGQFLPLGMWEQQGADTDLIQRNTEPRDVRWNNQLGWTYRVVIESESKRRKVSQIEAVRMAESKKRRTLKKAIEGPKEGDKEEKKDKKKRKKGSSSDSSSDSSSSSDDSKEDKPEAEAEVEKEQEDAEPVETPAERQARFRRERIEARQAAAKAKAKAKAAAKELKATQAKALKLRPKIVSALNALRAAVGHHLIFECPEPVVKPARQLITTFERLLETVELMIQQQDSSWPSCLDSIPFADARKTEQLLLAMIRGIAAARGIKL